MAETGDDTAAGDRPAADVPAARIKPTDRRKVDNARRSDTTPSSLEAPIPLGAILGDIRQEVSRDARQRQEALQRRLADRDLLARLAAHQFAGRAYDQFENELAAYGLSVLQAWMYSGYVFKLASTRGHGLRPSERELEALRRDSDLREELANMTVGEAMPRFRERALVGGGWTVDGGASVPTYFMGSCLYVFPNVFRRSRVYVQRHDRALLGERRHHDMPRARVTDAGIIATGNMRVDEALKAANGKEKAILELTWAGYQQTEIAELLSLSSARAVEGILRRWRKRQLPDYYDDRGETGGRRR